MDPIFEVALKTWRPCPAESDELITALERGQLIYCPHLNFVLSDEERQALDPMYCAPGAKNLSYCVHQGKLNGVKASSQITQTLTALIARFAEQAMQLVQQTLPSYAQECVRARTSLRLIEVVGRKISSRKDDTRLHVDAFPSAPNQGQRLLRVFCNINPYGQPRVWRVGEPFEQVAQHFLPATSRPWPGLNYVLAALRITKGVQSAYDHLMLQLHDRMKADNHYQATVVQQEVKLAAGSSWIVMTDQVSHAAMSGQFLLEQTFLVPVNAMQNPEQAPVRILERLTHRTLV